MSAGAGPRAEMVGEEMDEGGVKVKVRGGDGVVLGASYVGGSARDVAEPKRTNERTNERIENRERE